MPRWPGHRATQSTAIGRHGTSTLAVRPTGDLRRRHTTVGRVASPGGLIIRLIIQTIRRDRSGSVWTDEASNVSRPDPSGADQIDVEHQATDLAVGVRIPRGAPANPQLSGPATGLLALSDCPDCDQTATTSAGTQESTATMCDHNRLSMGRSPWTTAGAGRSLASGGCGAAHQSTLGSLGEPCGGLCHQAVPARWGPGDLTSTLRMRGAYPWLQSLSHQCWSCPPRGSGAARPSGALRAIDSSTCPRSWRAFGPRRLRRRSQACLGCHPG